MMDHTDMEDDSSHRYGRW